MQLVQKELHKFFLWYIVFGKYWLKNSDKYNKKLVKMQMFFNIFLGGNKRQECRNVKLIKFGIENTAVNVSCQEWPQHGTGKKKLFSKDYLRAVLS